MLWNSINFRKHHPWTFIFIPSRHTGEQTTSYDYKKSILDYLLNNQMSQSEHYLSELSRCFCSKLKIQTEKLCFKINYWNHRSADHLLDFSSWHYYPPQINIDAIVKKEFRFNPVKNSYLTSHWSKFSRKIVILCEERAAPMFKTAVRMNFTRLSWHRPASFFLPLLVWHSFQRWTELKRQL